MAVPRGTKWIDPSQPFHTAPPLSVRSAFDMMKQKVEEKFSSYRDAFKQISGSYSKALVYDEFKTGISALVGDDFYCDSTFKKVFDALDTDSDGLVSWDEFHSGLSQSAGRLAPSEHLPLKYSSPVPIVDLEGAYALLFRKLVERFGSCDEMFLAMRQGLDKEVSREGFERFLSGRSIHLGENEFEKLWADMAFGDAKAKTDRNNLLVVLEEAAHKQGLVMN